MKENDCLLYTSNKGVYVKGFSPRDIDDMFEIRLALEGLAIQLAIDRMDEVHLAKIKDVFELMEFYTSKNEQEKINDLNILYHETIYQDVYKRQQLMLYLKPHAICFLY